MEAQQANVAVPLEPLYATRVACELVPFSSMPAFYQWLSKHKQEFPARYRRVGVADTRMFTLSEIKRMRDMLVYDVSDSRCYPKPGRPRGAFRVNPVVQAVMRRAMGLA